MKTFEDVEELVTRLEAGTIDRGEALEQIAAARIFLNQVRGRLGRIAGAIQDDPLTLWNIKKGNLANELFKDVLDREEL
jgi:hypothetical protein